MKEGQKTRRKASKQERKQERNKNSQSAVETILKRFIVDGVVAGKGHAQRGVSFHFVWSIALKSQTRFSGHRRPVNSLNNQGDSQHCRRHDKHTGLT